MTNNTPIEDALRICVNGLRFVIRISMLHPPYASQLVNGQKSIDENKKEKRKNLSMLLNMLFLPQNNFASG